MCYHTSIACGWSADSWFYQWRLTVENIAELNDNVHERTVNDSANIVLHRWIKSLCFKISDVFHARLPTRQRLPQRVGCCYKVIGKDPGDRYSKISIKLCSDRRPGIGLVLYWSCSYPPTVNVRQLVSATSVQLPRRFCGCGGLYGCTTPKNRDERCRAVGKRENWIIFHLR